jgi:hypothetical protein
MSARRDRIAVTDGYSVDRAGDWLVQLYQARGKPLKAAEWKKKRQASKATSQQQSLARARLGAAASLQ